MKIRTRSFFLLVALPCLLPVAADAALQEAVEAAAVDAIPSAREVIDRALEATGMRARLESDKAVQMSGRVEFEGMGLEGSFERYSARPNLLYMRVSLSGMGDVETGYDGKTGWVVHPMLGPYAMEGAELLQMQLQATEESVLKTPAAFEVVEMMGVETFEERSCFKVKLVAKAIEGMDAEASLALRTSYEFYDVEAGYLVGTRSTAATPMGDSEVTLVLGDYKDFEGTKWPTTMVQKMPMGRLKFTIDSAQYPAVDGDRFQLPEAIRALTGETEASGSEDR